MNLRPLLIIPPVVLGVLGFMWLTRNTDVPVETEPEARVAVRVATVTAAPLIPTAVGYGRAEAAHNWSAVSEVEGRIVQMAEGLAEGSFVDAGETMIEVDRTDYELSIRKSKANIAAAQAKLAELDRQEANSRTSLEIEQRVLQVAQTEYDRVKALVESGASTQTALNSAEKILFAQQTAVTNITNTLALFPAQRASAEATLAVRRAELAEAERALSKTAIIAPYRGRVSALNVEQGQFIRTGEVLLSLDSADAVEIVAEVQPLSFRSMVQTALGTQFAPDALIDTSKAMVFLKRAGVTARVSFDMAGVEAAFDADIVRMRGTIDNETGTIGVVVRVNDPFLIHGTSDQVPLNVGTFVTVTLSAPAVEGAITVPRVTVQQDDDGAPFVYLSDADDRLDLRPVTTGAVVGQRVVITGGLSGGETLVLSAPNPPIPGIRLAPVAAARSE